MNMFERKLRAALALAVVLALLLAQVTIVQSDSYSEERGLTFLADVVGLDMARYRASSAEVLDMGSDASGILQNAKYELESTGNKLEVIFNLRNNAIVACKLYPSEGSPIFAQQSTNVLDSAKDTVQIYQAFSGASYVHKLQSVLETMKSLEPGVTVFDDSKLLVTVAELTYFDWVPRVNGIDIGPNSMHFAFRNGNFEAFYDNWNIYQIGSTVSVAKEEAIKIARDAVQGYSYTVGDTVVNNFTIVDSPPPKAEMHMVPRENNLLYPWWNIYLYLDKMYPGMVTYLQVTLWGDTEEVQHIEALGGGGDL